MYKILTAMEINALRKEHGENVAKLLEAGNGSGCKIAIVENSKTHKSLESEAYEALSPLSYEESIRILETMILPDAKILVCFWQGETIYSIRERRAMAEAAAAAKCSES